MWGNYRLGDTLFECWMEYRTPAVAITFPPPPAVFVILSMLLVVYASFSHSLLNFQRLTIYDHRSVVCDFIRQQKWRLCNTLKPLIEREKDGKREKGRELRHS